MASTASGATTRGERAEQLPLDREVLRRGLDHDAAGREILERGAPLDAVDALPRRRVGIVQHARAGPRRAPRRRCRRPSSRRRRSRAASGRGPWPRRVRSCRARGDGAVQPGDDRDLRRLPRRDPAARLLLAALGRRRARTGAPPARPRRRARTSSTTSRRCSRPPTRCGGAAAPRSARRTTSRPPWTPTGASSGNARASTASPSSGARADRRLRLPRPGARRAISRAAGHAVRGTTRDPARGAAIAAAGAEPYVGDPDRIATLMEALAGRDDPVLADGHGDRRRRARRRAARRPPADAVGEARRHAGARRRPRGGRAARARACWHAAARSRSAAHATWRIPLELLETDPADHERWRARRAAPRSPRLLGG